MPPSRRRMSRADRRSSSSTAMGMQDRSLAPGPTSSSFLVSGFATPRAMAPTLDASSITLASNYIRLDPLTAATQKLGAGQDMQGYFEVAINPPAASGVDSARGAAASTGQGRRRRRPCSSGNR